MSILKKTKLKKPRFGKLIIRTLSSIEKRKRFIISTLLLTGVITVSSFFSLSQAEFFLAVLIPLVYILTFFSILEGIDKSEWIMLFILPVFFTVAFYLFYFFLPGRWLTRLPYVGIYAVSIYAILLSSNIFSVGVVKNLQLFRAAFSVNFMFVTFTSFLVYSLLLSMRLNFLLNFLAYIIITFPLALQFLWSVQPEIDIKRKIVRYALLVTVLVSQVGLFLSFVPIKSSIFALMSSAALYSLLGLTEAYLQDRLFVERVREYVFVLIFVIIILLLSVRWG